jgi:hypothetical protein
MHGDEARGEQDDGEGGGFHGGAEFRT